VGYGPSVPLDCNLGACFDWRRDLRVSALSVPDDVGVP
jgi:hypothetical protein